MSCTDPFGTHQLVQPGLLEPRGEPLCRHIATRDTLLKPDREAVHAVTLTFSLPKLVGEVRLSLSTPGQGTETRVVREVVICDQLDIWVEQELIRV